MTGTARRTRRLLVLIAGSFAVNMIILVMGMIVGFEVSRVETRTISEIAYRDSGTTDTSRLIQFIVYDLYGATELVISEQAEAFVDYEHKRPGAGMIRAVTVVPQEVIAGRAPGTLEAGRVREFTVGEEMRLVFVLPEREGEVRSVCAIRRGDALFFFPDGGEGR